MRKFRLYSPSFNAKVIQLKNRKDIFVIMLNEINAEGLFLPVVTIPGIVAFPSVPVNFEILRDTSIKSFLSADKGDKTLVLAFSKKADNYQPKAEELSRTVIVAKVEQSYVIGTESVQASFRGICRAAVLSYTEKKGALFAEIIPEEYKESVENIRTKALKSHIINKVDEIAKLLPPEARTQLNACKNFKDLGQLCDYVAYTVFQKHEDKLAVLEEYNEEKRALLVCTVLENEIEICKQELIIHQKIQQSLERGHYENYLREKEKAIREELGEDDDEIEGFDSKLQNTVFSSDKETDLKIREKLSKELNKLAKIPNTAPEAIVLRNYIETCLELPWTVKTEDSIDVEAAKAILDKDHYGLEKPKERILEYLAVKQLNPDIKNQIICLVGPPGIGKTSLGASIANAMGRKYARVSLGGIHDEADIRGHRKTYIGSMPGRIITAVEQAGSANPVIILDEIDKMTKTMQGDPSSAMLEVLDPEQNKNFRDHYIELPFDLSDCMFICTANVASDIPAPLYDRMEIIEITTYTDNEKFTIAKNHLIPKQLKRHGLKKAHVKFKDDAIYEIIDGYTGESGVRNLERTVASILRKAAKKIASDEAKSITVSKRNLIEYLGPRRNYNTKIDSDDLCGVVNGLAYTSVGGDLLKIESSVMPGNGKVKLTGTLGDVMKESAEIALSYIRAHADNLEIDKDFYKTRDIHVHVPEGATPKDGPSAGVTMLTSLTSALSGKTVRHDVAMTGELTLTGRVLPIGGLKEKTFAAYKAGVRTVIIPKDNLPDLEEIDKTVRESIEFKPVTRASEVLNIALNS